MIISIDGEKQIRQNSTPFVIETLNKLEVEEKLPQHNKVCIGKTHSEHHIP